MSQVVSYRGGLISQVVSHRGGLISQVVSCRDGLISQVVSCRGGLISQVVSYRGGLMSQVVSHRGWSDYMHMALVGVRDGFFSEHECRENPSCTTNNVIYIFSHARQHKNMQQKNLSV